VAVFGAKAVLASTPHLPVSKPKKAVTTRKKKPTARAPIAKKAPRPRHVRTSARPKSVDPGVWAKLNDPGLGQVEGALSRTGEHPECVNAFGVFDMVGNLHEWVATDAALPHGSFQGGYYLDTAQNGDGCNYRTVAHGHDYHDYSTGFRCCAEPE
jgi:formylglycine-generating enzyme required for sulfatase activity